MFKVTAIKEGKHIDVLTLEVDKGVVGSAIYKKSGGQITWDFTEAFDTFTIEEVHTKKGEQNESS